MKTFIIEYTDGKEIAIEAELYEEHDGEFLFRRPDSAVIDRVRAEWVRSIREARDRTLQWMSGFNLVELATN